MSDAVEAFVSVDVETAGPIPARFALLAIGACLVTDPERAFYAELQPWTTESDPEAMAVHGLSLDALARDGEEPAAALLRFEDWLASEIDSRQPIFVGHNAAFDWMFIADAFWRHLGHNPFGHAALDAKSYFAGLTRVRWRETSLTNVAGRYGADGALPHRALEDAQIQARLFAAMLTEAREAR